MLNSKTIIFSLQLLAFSLCRSAPALSVAHVEWNKINLPIVNGYRVHYGIVPGTYTNTINVGSATNCTIADVIGGQTYYFAVTAYDAQGNSGPFSSEIAFAPPVQLNHQKITFEMEQGWSPLGPFALIAGAVISTTNPLSLMPPPFYRVRITSTAIP